MSRKRDTNWSRDEITVLLDSIMEITRTRAIDGKRTNSREVFEYAAKKMGEKGHGSRAEREKCRTKWKKMKEEFTHAKRAREGDTRFKEAPGIQPFFDRMEEFINGQFDNISPHSTIVRRTSSLSSGRPSSGGSGGNSCNTGGSGSSSLGSSSNGSGSGGVAMRASARIAANSGNSGVSPNTSANSNNVIGDANIINNQDTGSTITLTKSNASNDYSLNLETQSSLSPRQNHSRLSSSSTTNSNSTTNYNSNCSANNLAPSTTNSSTVATNTTSHHQIHHHHHHQSTPCSQAQSIFKGDMCINSTAPPPPLSYNNTTGTTTTTNSTATSQNTPSANNNSLATTSPPSTNLSSYTNHHNDLTAHAHSAHEHADISYRVSSGCRQITIFGDHDVDIKFRGDCITINKIDVDYSSAETS